MKKLLEFSFRKEGEVIPEGISLTQSRTYWYVRVRDLMWGIRTVRIPKGVGMIAETEIVSFFKEKPINQEYEAQMQDFLENHNDY